MSGYQAKRARDVRQQTEAKAEKQQERAEAQLAAEAALREDTSTSEVALAEESPEGMDKSGFVGLKETFSVRGGARV